MVTVVAELRNYRMRNSDVNTIEFSFFDTNLSVIHIVNISFRI